MRHHPSITMRFGAAHNEITVDGKRFDLSTHTRAERAKIRRIIVGALSTR